MVLVRLKVLFLVSASLPITAIASELSGILPLHFMVIDMHFLTESTFLSCLFPPTLRLQEVKNPCSSNELSPSAWQSCELSHQVGWA